MGAMSAATQSGSMDDIPAAQECARCQHTAYAHTVIGRSLAWDKCQADDCDCGAFFELADPVGRKDDSEKEPMHLLPPRAVRAFALCLGYGARKYGEWNWLKVAGHKLRYTGAILRHTFAYLGGETMDPESGCPHMAHVMCNAAFLVEREGES